jgi:NAD(P)-dependent dehydrogenase (short-subunit alcohol dehydrogenase family)
MDGLPFSVTSTVTLWHEDAAGGGSPPHHIKGSRRPVGRVTNGVRAAIIDFISNNAQDLMCVRAEDRQRPSGAALMRLFDLTDHVAIVTGGNGGLGLAMARGLAKANARIAIWGRNAAKNAEALRQLRALDAEADAFECDVTDRKAAASAFAATIDRFGQVDSCFANAGGAGKRGAFHELSIDDWNATVDLNLSSVVNSFQPVIAHLLARKAPGKLVVTSSEAALLGMPMSAGYSTTKAAVVGLARSLAIELGRANIQVNAILPGFIETEMSLNTPKFFQDAARRRSASGEAGKLEDMEGIAVYLASCQSDFMTGQAIVLDGGHSIHPF